MTTPSSSKEKGHGRRLLVTLVVTTATAAITTGVALKTHQAAENAAPRIAVNSTPWGVAAAPAPAFPHRVEWRDPWRRPAAPTEAGAMSIGNAPDRGAMRPDPSLPSAAAALQGGSDAAEEPATF